jgi:hypothetical protein
MPATTADLQPLLDAVRKQLGLSNDDEAIGVLLHRDVMDAIGSQFATANHTPSLGARAERHPFRMSATAADALAAKIETFLVGLQAASGLDKQSLIGLLQRSAAKIAAHLKEVMNSGPPIHAGLINSLMLRNRISRPKAIMMSKLAMRKQGLL